MLSAKPRMVTAAQQQGFTLIVVFMIMIAMISVAAAVMVTTQGDLRVAGQDRQAAAAFYAAEAGDAFARDWLAKQNVGLGAGAFTALLQSGALQLCAPGNGSAPGTVPKTAQGMVSFDSDRGSQYQYCIHNNADDAAYANSPSTGDSVDSDGIVAIESYGYAPNGAANHVTVSVRAALGPTIQPLIDGAQQGGPALKNNVMPEFNAAEDGLKRVTIP